MLVNRAPPNKMHNISQFLVLFFLQAVHLTASEESSSPKIEITSLIIEKTRAFALIFSSINCLSETNEATAGIREINQNFNPEDHLHEYHNQSNVLLLLQHVQANQAQLPAYATEAFAFDHESVSEILLILGVLFPNTGNWPLFYNTSAWLIGRVTGGNLYYSLSVITGQRFTHFVVNPSAVEVYPQMFIDTQTIAEIAGVSATAPEELDPLHYYIADPLLNEYHWNWHIDNIFFWNESMYPKADRQGELFFYMHHQLVSRYNAERVTNGFPYVTRLEHEPDFVLGEPYYPDIINANYEPYPTREVGTTMWHYDNGVFLSDLRTWFDLMEEGIDQGYLLAPDGSEVSLAFENATDLLGYACGGAVASVNLKLYGDVHGGLHQFLAGLYIPGREGEPGVQASSSTSVRDPVFFQLHKKVDQLYMDAKTLRYKPYTSLDLDNPDIQIYSVNIRRNSKPGYVDPPHTLSTYFDWIAFDISTAARPCRGIGGEPILKQVQILQHDTFDYLISVQSRKPTKAYGMVRIFLLPQFGYQGRKLSVEESHQYAIQLDLFRVQFDPREYKTIVRSSRDSTVTRMPLPGLKTLHAVNSSSEYYGVLQEDNKRACGFPNNLLIPKGTKEGSDYKLFVMISEEPKPLQYPFLPWWDYELPHYTYCGMLDALKYPDRQRSMGYPFDRPGTRFTFPVGDNSMELEEEYSLFGNVRMIPVKIMHRDVEDK